MLIYFLKGGLPWQGIKADTTEQKFDLILRKKIATSIEELTRGIPKEFGEFIDFCRRLQFDEKPDYIYLKKLFREVLVREGFSFDYNYDWALVSLYK
jgi:hypothetical protein